MLDSTERSDRGFESDHGPGLDRAIAATRLMAQGDMEAALVHLREAVGLGEVSRETLLNLALAETATGQVERGARLLDWLEADEPEWDEIALRRAQDLRRAGDHAAAEAGYRRTLTLNPARIEALVALGMLCIRRNAPGEAVSALTRACEIDPGRCESWDGLGIARMQGGDFVGAAAAFDRARAISPGHVAYALHRLEAALGGGAAERDADRLRDEAATQPLSAAPLAALGWLHERQGQRAVAMDMLEAACELAPDDADIHRLLGGILGRTMRAAEAVSHLRRAHALAPDDLHVQNDLAAMLMRTLRHGEAVTLLRDAIDRDGARGPYRANLANALTNLGRHAEARATIEAAIADEPSAFLPRRVLNNTLPYDPDVTGQATLDAARAANAVLPRGTPRPLRRERDPDRPLRIGLLGGMLKTHPVGWLTLAGFEALDRSTFTLIAFGMPSEDPLARRFAHITADWVDSTLLDDAGLAAAIDDAGIDVLIDLGGYGDAGRMTACATRMAPVQIKWVGMQSHTTGLAEMDWFITDRWETPDGFDRFYSERLLRLPDGYVCYTPPVHAPSVSPLPMLVRGHVTFGSFNNRAKITETVIAAWSDVLHRVADGRIVLKAQQFDEEDSARRMHEAFATYGIAPDRVELRGTSNHRELLRQYGDVDVLLDPFPYTGGLTTCEALWMGVPSITLPGETFASRHAVSHLSNVGLADWAAGSRAAYVELAARWARDPDGLAMLRASLRERVRASPLCDAPRFGRNLGAALRHAWRDWCRHAAPQPSV